ncbi:MAG: hypothetical protein JXB08_03680 [Bacilli bacterium]|nr:hypothetical protein [Bacilli bacterium]MBN2876277.1 hypothetical protein [Bacilli bacterium]
MKRILIFIIIALIAGAIMGYIEYNHHHEEQEVTTTIASTSTISVNE